MNSHELARILLANPDVEVSVKQEYFHYTECRAGVNGNMHEITPTSGPEEYTTATVRFRSNLAVAYKVEAMRRSTLSDDEMAALYNGGKPICSNDKPT